MSENTHSPRIAVLETQVKWMREQIGEMKVALKEQAASNARIEQYIAAQTSQLRLGKWVISGAFALVLIVIGGFVKQFIEG
jgi:hypothetical protein